MIEVSEKHRSIILEHLVRFVPACEVRVFGSRHNGRVKKYSDLDLAIKGKEKLAPGVLPDLREAFQESDIPWRVDVLDWWEISKEFREVIERKGFGVIQEGAEQEISKVSLASRGEISGS